MKVYLFALILSLSVIYSCQKDEAIFDLYPEGSFTYQSYDTLGNLIVNGWLKYEYVDSVTIEGSWYLNNLSNRDDIGLQNGDGKLVGTVQNSSISLNLNPEYADHNVYLDGIINDEVIEGKWIWATFIGPTNWGSFKALKN